MASSRKSLRDRKLGRRKLNFLQHLVLRKQVVLDPKPAEILSSCVILQKLHYLDASFPHLQNEDHNDIPTSQGCCESYRRQYAWHMVSAL